MRLPSLKARITVLTSCLVGLLWLLAVAATWLEARHEAEELFDAHLVQAASLLIVQTSGELKYEQDDEDEDIKESHAPLLHRYGRRVAFQIWIDHQLRLHSANAPNQPLSMTENGLSDSTVEGVRWRVFSAWNERRQSLVQVGERMAARDELARAVAAGLLRPLLVALPLLALLIWLAVRQGVRPMERLAAEIEERSPDKLAPLPIDNLPTEVLPLVEHLNALFNRVAGSFEQERRFTADAAHELRTPLAGLKAQAQVALSATDDAGRKHALNNLIRGCDRMTHLVEQLLALARIDAARPVDFVPLDFSMVVRESIAQLVGRALDKGVEIELAAAEAAPMRGNPAWMSVLVRNLVDNAVCHSPSAGKVAVAVARTQGEITLEVQDSGPGVPEAELAHLGQRFWRSPGSREKDDGGSGLGLSIVGRIVDLHRGSVEFRNASPASGRGFSVRVRFPLSIESTQEA